MGSICGPKTLFVVFLFSLFVRPSEGTVTFGRILRFVGTSTDVGDFAERLTDFFGLGDKKDNILVTSEELSKRIGDLIEASKPTVLSNLLQTSKLDRIYDAVIAMHSSLKDLRQVVQAGDGHLAAAYRHQFITNFQEAEVIKHIRFLPELLTYVVPGFDVPLLQQVKEKAHCNSEAIGTFRDFYVNLITNGIALQATYEEFTKNVTLQIVLKTEWMDSLDKVQSDFDSIERKCFNELDQRAQSNCQSSDANSIGISWTTMFILKACVVFVKWSFVHTCM